jgi:hypothetical protein
MFDDIRLDCSFNLTGIDKKQELTSPLLKFYLLNITRRRQRGEDSSLLYNNQYTVFLYFLSTVLITFFHHPKF